ncbi:hypothetical protein COO91_10191 (plasmid) [Nostoc flagelliforme CCNUN1]|uniref:Uncharacterized protein n=1 Tax=Nostoc flagelliforme CCNUN1 TaxID=2038116 RepID=A0A2K8SK95_9NOSO|nr:hypothetical protein COO91_01045 [Nostoc flagelliforme CCNUN1]AUB35255.1 hypothetical protein COO91_01131 [Nostoc flagelliforme CCNUN1]AUB43977.1 hypothetical protein COO91_10191 [Nostoc flagelliforme CCNUN1]
MDKRQNFSSILNYRQNFTLNSGENSLSPSMAIATKIVRF